MPKNGDAPSLRDRAMRGGAWAGVGSAASAAIVFASFLFLSRLLGPQAFGVLARVDASLALGQRLMASGRAEPLIQMRDLEQEHADTMFWSLQVLGVVLVIATIAVSGANRSLLSLSGARRASASRLDSLVFSAASAAFAKDGPGKTLAESVRFWENERGLEHPHSEMVR